jgi:hypothetical protein
MTPQDKAKELVDKFTVVGLQQRNEGIQCALIMCDELLSNSTFLLSNGEIYFWQKVKHEIENYEQYRIYTITPTVVRQLEENTSIRTITRTRRNPEQCSP